ncbi:MAG: hypothetical protein AB7G75_05065 [Candidatus Binatia bacterium]
MDHRLTHFWPGLQLHWQASETLWASRAHDILMSRDNGVHWNTVSTLPTPLGYRVLSKVGPLRRLLRLDIRSYLQLGESGFVVFRRGCIFRWQPGDLRPRSIGQVRYGNGPLFQGACVDHQGHCYYGEYWRNPRREEVRIYTLRRDAEQWDVFYSFPQGAIRHVHAVQFDPFSQQVWIATGDHDRECHIGYFVLSKSTPRFETIASGTQMNRAVSLLFTPDFVYWGTDGDGTGVMANYVYRWSRSTKQIEQVAEVGGPVYYSTIGPKGQLVVATVVEGGAAERDRVARVWISRDGSAWREIGGWLKDKWPFIFGHGVLCFPGGPPSSGRLYVVGTGVRNAPGTWVLETP